MFRPTLLASALLLAGLSAATPASTTTYVGGAGIPNVVLVDPATGNPYAAAGSSASLPSTIGTGQAKIAVSNTAVALPTVTATNGVVITANPSNAASIEIGSSGVTTTANGTGNGYVLAPGASISLSVSNYNAAYINGTAGDWVSYAGN